VLRSMMKAKIHRATVTDANLDYVGSISIDPILMKAADLVEFEQVHVLDVDNGNRLITYVMEGDPGGICINGAAAHLVRPGHKVIIISYADYSPEELVSFRPTIVHVDEQNRETVVDDVTLGD
jgi:aspartate 1-decarboxylase